ncbi:50S ribosomal protein L30e [Candidatus Micrarchaeota archaeon CG10_big_fil_rev_8_21_14_0_10_59_7]|nr:MAG: 50S ribosomal protein L30e [Candidatus Micrarchaeota archaeon CG10_big_fil_rev_8_21_14_0_10_59_7]
MAGIEVDKSIRLCVDSGKVELGADRTKKLLLTSEPKLVVLAANCPANTAQELRRYGELAGVPILDYPGTSVELGVVCGKPFCVSAMAVLNAGNSEIMQAVKKK